MKIKGEIFSVAATLIQLVGGEAIKVYSSVGRHSSCESGRVCLGVWEMDIFSYF